MNRMKLLMIGAGLLFAAPAFAQVDGAGSGSTPAGGTEIPPAAAGAGTGSAAPTDAGTAAAGTPAEGVAMIDRHYVVDKAKIGAYADFDISHLSITGGTPPMTISATGEFFHLGGGYGITDKITAGLDYAFPIAGDVGDKGKGPLAIFGMFELVHSAKMSITATADFTADFGGSDGMGGTTTIKTIHAGLGAKYLVAPKVAIFTGAPFGPGPVGQHLSISLESSGPINFSLPVGVGFQAMPKLFAYLNTELATFRLANAPMGADTVSVIFSDIEKGGIGIPLALGGFYAVTPQIDAGANLTFLDLAHAGDFYSIGLAARWRQ